MPITMNRGPRESIVATALAVLCLTGVPTPVLAQSDEQTGVQVTSARRAWSPGVGGVRASFAQTNKVRSRATAAREAARQPHVPVSRGVSGRRTGGTRIVTDGASFSGGTRLVDGRSFSSGSTFTLDGSVSGDNFNADFHLGSDPADLLPRRRVCPPVAVCPPWNWCGTIWNPTWGYWWGWDDDDDDVIVQGSGPYIVDASLLNQEQLAAAATAAYNADLERARPETPTETAVRLLRMRDYDGAITELRAYLADTPEDAEMIRLLGAALILDGRPADGVAAFALAYRQKPQLAYRPFRADALPRGEEGLKALVGRAVRFAHNSGSASAWLTVSALMQAQGKQGLAAQMLERAEAAGLEPGSRNAMKTALGG